MNLSGAVAQLVERPTQNRKGLGSIPGSSSSFKQRIRERERNCLYCWKSKEGVSESSAHGFVKCLVLSSSPENLSAL